MSGYLVLESEKVDNENNWIQFLLRHVLDTYIETGHLSIYMVKLTVSLMIVEEVCKLVQKMGILLSSSHRRLFAESAADSQSSFFRRSIKIYSG